MVPSVLPGTGGHLTALEPGHVEIRAVYRGVESNTVSVEVLTPDAGMIRILPTDGLTLDLWSGPFNGALSAERYNANGDSEDVTDEVAWIFANPFLAMFDARARTVEALQEGETEIRVRSGFVELESVPLRITDSGPPTRVFDWMLME